MTPEEHKAELENIATMRERTAYVRLHGLDPDWVYTESFRASENAIRERLTIEREAQKEWIAGLRQSRLALEEKITLEMAKLDNWDENGAKVLDKFIRLHLAEIAVSDYPAMNYRDLAIWRQTNYRYGAGVGAKRQRLITLYAKTGDLK